MVGHLLWVIILHSAGLGRAADEENFLVVLLSSSCSDFSSIIQGAHSLLSRDTGIREQSWSMARLAGLREKLTIPAGRR